ncbi:autotransporter outer membrane beta-barrel domain-containing protein [Microvirga sp. W0021]|uniref:Autotransporter outer membrane beta-barrel domain-containing protein n=1 Tax=Hohaiivirga grylli TaxID=3133970 RepID=A0ABV0BM12_9HYPH
MIKVYRGQRTRSGVMTAKKSSLLIATSAFISLFPVHSVWAACQSTSGYYHTGAGSNCTFDSSSPYVSSVTQDGVEYLYFGSNSAPSAVISVSGGSSLHILQNAYINQLGGAARHGISVSNGTMTVDGNLIAQSWNSTSSRAMYIGTGGVVTVNGDLYTYRNGSGGATSLQVTDGGILNVAGSGYIYSDAPGTQAFRSYSESHFGGDLTITLLASTPGGLVNLNALAHEGTLEIGGTLNVHVVDGVAVNHNTANDNSITASGLNILTTPNNNGQLSSSISADGYRIIGGSGTYTGTSVIDAQGRGIVFTGATGQLNLAMGGAPLVAESGVATLGLGSAATVTSAQTAIVFGDAVLNSYTLIKSGATVSGDVGLYEDGIGNATLEIEGGTILSGSISMGAGTDKLIIRGAVDFQNIPSIDGGVFNVSTPEYDVLEFTDAQVDIDGSKFTNWEDIKINGGQVNLLAVNANTLTASTETGHGIHVASGQLNVESDYTLMGNVTLDSAGMLAVGGTNVSHGSVQGFVSNAGSINLSNQRVGDTLTISGDYVSANGSVHLDSYLGNDTSATDRLIINGTATGRTLVRITNVGGSGDMTTGDGIMVIQTTSSDQSAFTLSGRVAAGAYEYNLYQGGNTATGGNPTDQNWYLRSTLQIGSPDTGTDGNNNSSNNINTGSRIQVPNYRPEVPLLASVMPIASEYGYAMLGSLHERTGGTQQVSLPAIYEDVVVSGKGKKTHIARTLVKEADQKQWAAAGWARVIGDRGFRERNNFEQHGPDYNYTFAGIQAGLDVFTREDAEGTLDRAGFYVGYGNVQADVKGAWYGKAGTIDMDAYTLGAYWTHVSHQGWYTDAVVQGTWYQASTSSIGGQRSKPDGSGIIASLEGGYSFDLGNGLTLEPQVQLAYQNLSFDNVRDAYGSFRFSDEESLRGRIGLRLAKTWNASADKTPRLITTWVRANVWHEFMGDSTTAVFRRDGVYSTSVTSSLSGTWAEIGAGVSGQVSDNVSLFATGAYNRSLDNKGREAWNGRLGLTVKW